MRKLAILLACVIALPALAQTKPTPKPRPALTGDPIADIQQALTQPGAPVTNAPCSFNIFSALEAKNLNSQIALCALGDVKAALDSATAAKDTVAVSCLTPALAIVQAASGAIQQGETGTAAPGTAAPPAPAGVILLFQKYREFVLAGGPSACKSWVNTTITGGSLLAQ